MLNFINPFAVSLKVTMDFVFHSVCFSVRMYWFVKNYLCKSSWSTSRSFIHTPAEEEHSLLLLSSQDRFFLGCCSGLFNIILLHCLLCSCTFTPKQWVHLFLWLSVEGKARHLHLSGLEVSWNSSASLDLISYLSMTEQLILSGLFVGRCPCQAVNEGSTTRIKTVTLCSFSSSLWDRV